MGSGPLGLGPQDPLEKLMYIISKGQKVHEKVDHLRRTMEYTDPLSTVAEVMDSINQKVRQVDSLAAMTKRRKRVIVRQPLEEELKEG